MLEFVIKNFKNQDNEKQIIEALPKLDKIVFNLTCGLIQNVLDELDLKIDSMIDDKVYDLEEKLNEKFKKKFEDMEWEMRQNKK